jgi:Concanavalin A-like lectin/glucanases superfamily
VALLLRRRRLRRILTARSRRLTAALLLLAGVAGSSGCSKPPVAISNERSLRFDGVDDSIDLGRAEADGPLALAGSPFTIAAWVRQEPGGDPWQRVVDKSDGPLGRSGWALGIDPASGQVHLYVGGNDFVGARGGCPPGGWRHVAAVARRDRLEIWVDGRRDGHATFESGSHALPPSAAAPLRIGCWNHEPGRRWKGWIDEVAVWSVDLSPGAIEALHAARGRADLRREWGAYREAGRLAGWWRKRPDPRRRFLGRLRPRPIPRSRPPTIRGPDTKSVCGRLRSLVETNPAAGQGRWLRS